MKRKSKAIGFLITGVALAIGIAISSGIIRNSYVADEAKAASSTAVLITNVSQLASGDNIVITNIAGDKALSKTQDSNNRDDVAVSLSGSLLSFDDSTTEIITLGTSNSFWTLYANTTPGYLYAASSSNNYLRTQATNNANGEWTITLNASFEATIKAQGNNTRNILQYNTSASLFSCYSSGQQSVKIFKVGSLAALESISISGTLSKTTYYAGDSFDPTGLTITANYDDESSANVTSECTFSPDPLTAGVTSVTASYTEGGVTKTADITGITVSTRTIETLEVTNNPAKMVYIVGESFDPTGMIVKATFDSGDPVNNYIGYVYSPSGVLNSVGAQVITISDAVETEVFTSLNVQVNEAPLITELFISEYIEGSSNNKAIEIYNGTGASVDLSIYSLKKQSNGAGGWGNDTVLSGTLTDKDVYIMAHSSATAGILALADSNNQGVMAFNGNDAIGLFKNDTLIDIVGVFNSTSNWGLDTTLVRKSSITSPSATYSSSNWDSYLVDTFTNLGSHTVITSTPQHELDAIAWGTDFLSATAAGCSALDQSQLLTAWSGLETSFNALSSEAKNYLTSLTPNVSGNDAQHAVARYIYIITKYGDATFADFMNLDIQAAPSVFDLFDDGYNYVPLIAVIGVVGLTVLIGYYYLKKRQEA